MNFIEEFKKFENWLLVHPDVSPSARLVWHSLFHYNNLCEWKEEFDLSMSALQLSTGLSAPTIRKAREQLRRMGRIAYRKGSMDHSAVYRLNPLASFGAVSSAKERAIDETAGKDDSERTTQRAYERFNERSNESSHERTVEGTNKEADTRTDERTYERPKETSTESTMESPTESTMESSTESMTESPIESTMESSTESTIESMTESPMESIMESPMERTEEKSDATFLAKPKQDNTRQSISKESVKKGRDGGPGTICRLLPTSGLVCRRNEDEKLEGGGAKLGRHQIVKKQTSSPNEQIAPSNERIASPDEQMPPKKYGDIDAGDGSYVDAEGLPIMFEYH